MSVTLRISPISLLRVFPESLRWLLATQQYYRSNRIMERIAKKNKVNLELDPENIFTGNQMHEMGLGVICSAT